jgi:NADH dehydrogenase FAD-containing subunit
LHRIAKSFTIASVAANLELASLPTTTPVERKKLLSFVVCGGGPTGVEFAAELADMMSEDVLSYVSHSSAFFSVLKGLSAKRLLIRNSDLRFHTAVPQVAEE